MISRNTRSRRRSGASWLRRQFSQRPLPAWLLVAIDVLLIGVSLVVFALFHHVLPRSETSTGMVSSRYVSAADVGDANGAQPIPGDDAPDATSDDPGAPAGTEPAQDATQREAAEAAALAEATAAEEAAAEAAAAEEAAAAIEAETAQGYFGSRFPDKFTDGQVIKTDRSYQSANVNITLSSHLYDGSVVYFADIYLRDIGCLRTEFADASFGRGNLEWPVDMNRRAGGILAVNGDYYGTRSDGVVIRNGELFRNKDVSMDVCVIYWNGVMETYSARQFRAKTAMERGAYQAWNFGPKLLDEDGKPMRHFSNASIGPRNPRTVLGYFEPGHYCFVVVDGRSEVSEGLTIKELARLMSKLGCKRAYNMDGGATSMLVVGDRVASVPYNGGRPSSDIITIVDK